MAWIRIHALPLVKYTTVGACRIEDEAENPWGGGQKVEGKTERRMTSYISESDFVCP